MTETESLQEESYDGQIERKLQQLAADVEDENPDSESAESANSILHDPDISQQLTRRNADGLDTLIGYFRCQFTEQQQRYALHVPLYPAMNKIPEVEAVVVDCEQAKVRITDRQKFGLRLEIVLPKPATAEQKLLVEVTAYSH